MPLCNRVDPFGAIHAVAARGLFTGNRGVIHDPATRTLTGRRWTTRAWIICACDFRGRHREVMGRNTPSGNAGWTELFFLDEVTALAAGHRPCFHCRRERAVAFARCFAAGRALSSIGAPEMDAVLHGERRAAGARARPIDAAGIAELPDGAMIEAAGLAFAMREGMALPWSWHGYGAACAASAIQGPLRLITPPATLAALGAGYRPVWHASRG